MREGRATTVVAPGQSVMQVGITVRDTFDRIGDAFTIRGYQKRALRSRSPNTVEVHLYDIHDRSTQKPFLIILGIWLCMPSTATAEFSARELFSIAPTELFFTEDELSDSDRHAVLHSTPFPGRTFNCERWGISEESLSSLALRICHDSFVRIQLFRETSGTTIVAIESNRSSGRAVDLRFFQVAGSNHSMVPLSPSHIRAQGLEQVSENDLLMENDHFPVAEAQSVPLRLDEEGRPKATVVTWNAPRWAYRTAAFDVIFEWDGAHFIKRSVRLR